MKWARLNIREIERTLLSSNAGELALRLNEEPMTEDMTHRLIDGYRYVDQWLATETDIFQMGQSGLLLELNHRVLCGVTPERRVQYGGHIAETERHFYDEPRGGIGAFADWYGRNKSRSPRLLAAGALVQVISVPQLYIEGNSRTGSLIASYCLARAGLPPLVVCDSTAAEYHTLIERCVVVHHTGLRRALSLGYHTYRFAGFIERTAEQRFLFAETIAAAPVHSLT